MLIRVLLATILTAGFCSPISAQPAMERYFQFRDGSLLRLLLVDDTGEVRVVRPEGRVERVKVRWSELRRLTLTHEPVFEQKRSLLATVQRLGADEFAEREQAETQILQMGPKVRADLEMMRGLFADPEIKSRLRGILAQWPPDKGPPAEPGFDLLTTQDTTWCDIGEAGIPVLVDGKVHRLARKDLAAMCMETPEGGPPSALTLGMTLSRLQPGDFPRGCWEEGFESTPDGRRLRAGENIERLFIRKGFLLSTSVRTSHVSVNDFVVQGKSRGFSVATHQPLFTGEITITFVKPGHEHIPAGVTHFGCWIAWIEPNGTALHAYDLQGRELGHITTTRSGHEFLGISSTTPIHKIRVVPNLKIDPDYTLDDFMFTPPQSADLGHSERALVHFGNGEQVLCKDISFLPSGLRLSGMPGGLPDRVRPMIDVVRMVAPRETQSRTDPPRGVFVELQDGSVLFGAIAPGMMQEPAFLRLPDVLRDPEKLVSIWSTALPRNDWPFQAPEKYPTVGVTDASRQTIWKVIGDTKFSEKKVEWTFPGEQGAATQRVQALYPELPPLLLKPAAPPAPGSWHIRTRIGEELLIGPADPPRMTGSLLRGVQVLWQGKEVSIAAADIAMIYRVPKTP